MKLKTTLIHDFKFNDIVFSFYWDSFGEFRVIAWDGKQDTFL